MSLLTAVTMVGCQEVYSPVDNIPVVETSAAENVGATRTTLCGVITKEAWRDFNFSRYEEQAPHYFFLLSEHKDLTDSTRIEAWRDSDTCYAEVIGLTPATTYYYALCVANDYSMVMGEVQSLTTGSSSIPFVETCWAVDTTLTGATLSGWFVAETSCRAHFVISEDHRFLEDMSIVVDATVVGDSCYATVSGLKPATSYYYKLVVSDAYSTVESDMEDVKKFTTKSIHEYVKVTNLPAKDIGVVSATVCGAISSVEGLRECFGSIRFKISEYEDFPDDETRIVQEAVVWDYEYFGGKATYLCRIGGLKPSTTYYYTLYETASIEGEECEITGVPYSFITQDWLQPVECEKKVFTVNGVDFTMVKVEGGTFAMGWEGDSQSPLHEVTLSDYWIAETELTGELYCAVTGENMPDEYTAQYPYGIVNIDPDWEVFFDKLYELTGEQFSLPTEAQWEFAARGGNHSRGYKYSGGDIIADVAVVAKSLMGASCSPVKSKLPNELGIYDMSGNVAEVCSDWYGPYPMESVTDPTGPSEGSYNVIRGGSVEETEEVCSRMNGTSEWVGIRLTLTSVKKEEPNPKPVVADAIDLGLSVKWASWNVGATAPEEYGGYYAWGETEVKDNYSEDTYLYYQNGEYVDIGTDISGTEYDVAHVKWGDGWRMPTLNEIKELINNCTWSWTTQNDVNGYKVTGSNGNSIFLPAAGYHCYDTEFYGRGEKGFFWSGTKSEHYSYYAFRLYFSSGYHDGGTQFRNSGNTVRPVYDAKDNNNDVDLDGYPEDENWDARRRR